VWGPFKSSELSGDGEAKNRADDVNCPNENARVVAGAFASALSIDQFMRLQ
jgi:hypothetical protein